MPMLSSHQSVLLVIDMQTGLLPAIHDTDVLLPRAVRLAQAARLCDVPVLATEHWAGKIGATHQSLLPSIDQVLHKQYFDATRETGFIDALPRRRHRVLLMGTEAHVCVLQTGLGLKKAGYEPVLVSDGVGSRQESDRLAALRRWDFHGLESISSEMAMFEWLENPTHPAFRSVLSLIK